MENIQRENLDPIEIALCYQRLLEEVGMTQDQMGSRVGKQRSTISNYLRLLNLDPIIQSGIRDGFISMGHGKALVSIKEKDYQLSVYKKILKNYLSVRQAENLSKKSNDKNDKKTKSKIDEPYFSTLKNLKKNYSSEVKIKLNGVKKGFIMIPFNNIEEFMSLSKKLNEKK